MTKKLLSGIYLFNELPSGEVDHLTRIVKAQTYTSGQVIFSQGDMANSMYVIRYGSVKMEREDSLEADLHLSLVASGGHFGEWGLVEGGKRGVRATAVESSELLCLHYNDLTRVFESNPLIAAHFYRAVAHSLTARLKEANRDLRFFRSRQVA